MLLRARVAAIDAASTNEASRDIAQCRCLTEEVQCKRQKEKVGKVVVNALWADVEHEKAKSGLIVTTTAVSPGARKVPAVRAYPIDTPRCTS
jgi:hypothetical protein